MEDKLKILAIVHGYFPNHNAGAEAMLHQILVDLKQKGHEVRVITRNPGAEEYEGVPIFPFGQKEEKHIAWSDIVFTHLDLSRYSVNLALRHKKPIVHLVHNDKQLAYNKVKDRRTCSLAIANSSWIRKTVGRDIPSVIVYPPTIPSRYSVETTREYITLINMNDAKGGKIFWQLARLFPDKKFLGVKGAYGEQIMYDKKLSNVTILENTPDIQEIYKKSRIVLMPSSYESWGRVGMEASCSGIPVIASPTPGLTESLDYAGIFAQHDDIVDWFEAIKLLDDPKVYEKYSKLTKKRSKEVADEFKNQMIKLETKLINLVFFK
jgi:glycosyltransferase involved in cell wall biosynthesis